METSSLIKDLTVVRKTLYIALALAAIGIIVNMKDIKRYIRISTM
jgi:hypothetical protein